MSWNCNPSKQIEDLANYMNSVDTVDVDNPDRPVVCIHTTDSFNRMKIPDNWKNFEEIANLKKALDDANKQIFENTKKSP